MKCKPLPIEKAYKCSWIVLSLGNKQMTRLLPEGEGMQDETVSIDEIVGKIKPQITPFEFPAFGGPAEISFFLVPGRGVYTDPNAAADEIRREGALYCIIIERLKGDGREGGVLSVTSVVLEKGKRLTVWAIPSGDSYRNETAANDALQPGQSLYQIIASRTE